MSSDELCKNCWRYKTFKDKCFFYWEDKRECSQFKEDQFSEEKYESTKYE